MTRRPLLPSRSLLLSTTGLLTASTLALAVPSAWAGFTTPQDALATFSTATIAAPVVTSAVKCTLSNSLVVAWSPSATAFVSGQVLERSTNGFSSVAASQTYVENVSAAHTFTSVGLGTHVVRVRASYLSWSATSTTVTATVNPLC